MKAIIELDVPDYQIGQKVSIYFKDTMMIKAIVQEPCVDVISRQAVLDIVDSYSESRSNIEDVTQDIISDIVALPPVTPQPCEDAIGRSDMLDAIGHGTTYTSEELQKIIKALPSVNPQKQDIG